MAPQSPKPRAQQNDRPQKLLTRLADENVRLNERVAELERTNDELIYALDKAAKQLEKEVSQGHGERWTAREMHRDLFLLIDSTLERAKQQSLL